MLKVNPEDVLNNNKLISINIDSILSLTDALDSKASQLDSKIKSKKSLDTSTFKNMVDVEMKKKISFLSRTVHELIEIMGESTDNIIESTDKILSRNYSSEDYEFYLLKNYVDKYKNQIKKGPFDIQWQSDLDVFYDFVYKSGNHYYYDPILIQYKEISDFIDRFYRETGCDFTTTFDLDEKKIYLDFLTMYKYEGDNIYNFYDSYITLFNENTVKYFNEVKAQLKDKGYFSYDINGKNIFFVFNFKDYAGTPYPDTAKLLYYFAQFDMIDYLKDQCANNSYYMESILDDFQQIWMSNYCVDDTDTLAYYGDGQINVILDKFIKGYFSQPTGKDSYYSAIQHEFNHAFDDSLVEGYENFFSSQSSVWNQLYEQGKSNNILANLQIHQSLGYNSETYEMVESTEGRSVAVGEFFAEALRAYFDNPSGLRMAWPELYNEIDNLVNNR